MQLTNLRKFEIVRRVITATGVLMIGTGLYDTLQLKNNHVFEIALALACLVIGFCLPRMSDPTPDTKLRRIGTAIAMFLLIVGWASAFHWSAPISKSSPASDFALGAAMLLMGLRLLPNAIVKGGAKQNAPIPAESPAMRESNNESNK
jgi:hypothetical protein